MAPTPTPTAPTARRPSAIAADGTVVHLHADQLGSVWALTGAAGAVVGTFAWDAYGNPRVRRGACPFPFGFAGEDRDAESGLCTCGPGTTTRPRGSS